MKKRNNPKGIVWICIIAFAVSVVFIKFVDWLFSIYLCNFFAIHLIHPSDVLSYLGGVAAAIVSGVLAYLVYDIEKKNSYREEKNNKMEKEKNIPYLSIEELYSFLMNLDIVKSLTDESWKAGYMICFIVITLMNSTEEHKPAIIILDKQNRPVNTKNDNKCRQISYFVELKYTGEIRCKRIFVTNVVFYDKTGKEIVNQDVFFEKNVNLCNGEKTEICILFISENASAILNGNMRITYEVRTINEQKQSYTVQIKKAENYIIPIKNEKTGAIISYQKTEIMQDIKYLEENLDFIE